MFACKGYIEGNTVVSDGFTHNLYDGREVVITILDTDYIPKKENLAKHKNYSLSDVQEAFGMWKDHEESEDVASYMRSMRKGRNFGI